MSRHFGSMPPGLPKGDPEDCGSFCVWWYTVPGRRGRPDARRWAVALRSDCGAYWRTSSPIYSDVATRDEAVLLGEEAADQ